MGDIVVQLDPARPQDRRELSHLCERQALRRHHLPPRDRRLHDPGRRLYRRHGAKPMRAPHPLEAANGLKNDKYTIAMARTSVPDSATAQFFINVKDNAMLNAPALTATATPCSARSSRAPRWSTRSRPWPPQQRAPTRTCPTPRHHHLRHAGGNPTKGTCHEQPPSRTAYHRLRCHHPRTRRRQDPQSTENFRVREQRATTTTPSSTA